MTNKIDLPHVILACALISFFTFGILSNLREDRVRVFIGCGVVGIVSSAVGIVAVLYRIARDRIYNGLLIIILYLFLIAIGTFVFSILYILDEAHFSGVIHRKNLINSMCYFSVATVSTIGYGDIVARSRSCRSVVIGFIAVSMFINMYAINLIFSKGTLRMLSAHSLDNII